MQQQQQRRLGAALQAGPVQVNEASSAAAVLLLQRFKQALAKQTRKARGR
jgi:hypothetical protein